MKSSDYVIGVDFGTDSVRSIIVDASNGEELASSVFIYPRWKEQLYCNASANQFRQHPLDYIEGIEESIKRCLLQAGETVAANVKAISVDTTGSTPIIVNKAGTPLSLLPGFETNPNAMFILWKDHTAVNEAAEINEHAQQFDINYLKYVGGIYSSEWFWAKLLHVLREDEQVRAAAYSLVEHCDWIPFLLTGGTDIQQLKRGVCSAGHKALFAKEFDGLPPNEFFASLDPLLNCFTSRLFSETYTSDKAAGNLSEEWALKLCLSTDVIVGVGAFDAHMGAVGGQIEPYHLCKIVGTSTCDILVAPEDDVKNILIKGICGQVPGSVIPGMMGMEAGQSAFGDAYAWFRDILIWPLKNVLSQSEMIDANMSSQLVEEAMIRLIPELTKYAEQIEVTEDTELAVDWFNGRRTPDANQLLEGAFFGLGLGTTTPAMFRAIAEATCFGAKAIVDRFSKENIPVKGLIAMGGVAKKSPFIMQMMADIIQMPIRVHKSEQTCASGAAMFAATAAGLYNKVEDAMQAMGRGFEVTYIPDTSKAELYSKRYKRYQQFGDCVQRLTMK